MVYSVDENGDMIPVVDEWGNQTYKKERYMETGIGTEHKGVDADGNPISTQHEHKYVELYTDPGFTTPLIDYSYCIDEYGNVIHDRWDYWSEDDFR
jgi:hypothetical protein